MELLQIKDHLISNPCLPWLLL